MKVVKHMKDLKFHHISIQQRKKTFIQGVTTTSRLEVSHFILFSSSYLPDRF